MAFSVNLFCHLLKIQEKINWLQFIYGYVILGKWAAAAYVPRNACFAKNSVGECEEYTKITQPLLSEHHAVKQSHSGNALC